MLYEAERHEPLARAAWDESRARTEIERIAADANRDFSIDGLWPIHPADRSPERPPDALKPLYHGAAGVVWALKYLDETGAVALRRDYLPTVAELPERIRDDLQKHPGVRDYVGRDIDSYLLGDTGILMLQWKLNPSEEIARLLHASIEKQVGDVRGLAWGGQGAMLAALFMFERTGEARWSESFRRHLEAIWNQWNFHHELHCHLWTFELYGVTEKRLGAIHGFTGSVYPMLRGLNLLPERSDELLSRIHQTLTATSQRDGEFLNWPNNAGASNRAHALPLFVQHCNGAAGVINCISTFPSGTKWNVDAILKGAGELIWRAGPLTKFPSLCHGIPGNGYALLKLFARTGDEQWLERARQFAMHAIDQCEAALTKFGQRKYSLWTGDLGLAVYLWDCIRGGGAFPTLDVF